MLDDSPSRVRAGRKPCVIGDGGVPSTSVVKDFDVLEEALSGLSSCLIIVMVYHFFFQGGEEGFHGSIVPAVSLATH